MAESQEGQKDALSIMVAFRWSVLSGYFFFLSLKIKIEKLRKEISDKR